MIPPAELLTPFDASPIGQAMAMLAAFVNVGATHFDITHTHLTGEKRGFRGNRDAAEVRRSMPYLVEAAAPRQNNVIIRPRSQTAAIVQLDDLDAAKVARVAPAAFLVIQTSPGSYQAWVAVRDAPIGTTTRLRQGTGADLNASGATRVAGTRNFKAKYAPEFPTVLITEQKAGHIVSVAELEQMGVLAPAKPEAQPIRITDGAGPAKTHKWPSYAKCLEGAPQGDNGNPKRTSVDFTWCKIAASWGHPVETTAARLMEESTKARENGERYAMETAQRAAWAARQRNRQMPRP